MRTISDLLELAKKNIGTTSDRELARQLGTTTVSPYRKRNVIPDDFTAMKLADLCGLPAHEVLITCHLLKAKAGESPEVHTEWKNILKMVSNACIVLAFLVAATLSPTTASAQDKWGSVYSATSDNIHYATFIIILFALALTLIP